MDLSSFLIWLGRLPLRWRYLRTPPDLPLREVIFPARDGTQLSGWYVPHPQARAGVLLCHGIYSTRMAMVARARMLQRWGYASLLFDFRGRGRSRGNCTLGFRESLDVLGGLDFLRAQLPGLPLAGLGESLGASSLLQAMALEGGLQCACLEACFATLEEAIAARAPRHQVAPIARRLESTYGLPIRDISPLRHVGRIKQPLFFIHDSLDWCVSLDASRRLTRSAAGPSQLWVAPWTLHTRAALMAAREYEYRVGGFFSEHLRQTIPVSQFTDGLPPMGAF
ncbi:MAG: alpha/beta hydrolase [Candidatus Eremiobacteraeota bacterium]|nr:alpha/beta hydrolase [Candidatus Eremiobacteraeota bacterium]MCW5868098.1 alpha/beta hydrolase [Candidatus Eremiobacteraeota bacterium]